MNTSQSLTRLRVQLKKKKLEQNNHSPNTPVGMEIKSDIAALEHAIEQIDKLQAAGGLKTLEQRANGNYLQTKIS